MALVLTLVLVPAVSPAVGVLAVVVVVVQPNCEAGIEGKMSIGSDHVRPSMLLAYLHTNPPTQRTRQHNVMTKNKTNATQ